MGAHRGMSCLACYWGLMLALIALGIMNPVWMGVIALFLFVEKIMPSGARFARLAGGLRDSRGRVSLSSYSKRWRANPSSPPHPPAMFGCPAGYPSS